MMKLKGYFDISILKVFSLVHSVAKFKCSFSVCVELQLTGAWNLRNSVGFV